MRAPWIADVLRAAGLNVVEEPGWESRGKEFVSIDGHMAHHTASPKTSTLAVNLSVVINGNSVAPGPIANVLLWRDGTCHVIASGRCNHAGKGVLPWVPLDQGNTHLLATEAVNDGIGELWAPEMVEAYEIGTAAMLRHLGLGSDRATTHSEYAPTRKIDPAGPTGGRIATLPGRSTWSPVAWRERIADRLRVPVPPPSSGSPLEDDPMILTNREPWFGAPAGTAKFKMQANGRLKLLTPAEWDAECNGTPISNAATGELGVDS